jgi:hypothetical protein
MLILDTAIFGAPKESKLARVNALSWYSHAQWPQQSSTACAILQDVIKFRA